MTKRGVPIDRARAIFSPMPPWTYVLDCPHCLQPNRQGVGQLKAPFKVDGSPRPVTLLCKHCGEEFSADLGAMRSVPTAPMN